MSPAHIDYERAIAAEPALQPIVATVDALCALVRADDTMCAGCVWDSIVKPLVSPLIGWERGLPLEQARDKPLTMREQLRSPSELLAEVDAAEAARGPATTDTERWLRTSEAFDAFTSELMRRLQAADPGTGHGIRSGEHTT